MRCGIIAEGRGDLAVITNILKGKSGIERSDIQYLVPELEYDETDLSQMRLEQFSNWEIVKQKCEEQTVFEGFLDSVVDDRFIVIHIDTAERELKGYDVPEPKRKKTENYSIELRENVIHKINEWLRDNFTGRLAFAVAIEETDAWVMTIYTNDKETGFYPNPKERLKRILNKELSKKAKKEIFSLEDNKFKQYILLSKDFRKTKGLNKFSKKNRSLKLFCESLESFQNPAGLFAEEEVCKRPYEILENSDTSENP